MSQEAITRDKSRIHDMVAWLSLFSEDQAKFIEAESEKQHDAINSPGKEDQIDIMCADYRGRPDLQWGFIFDAYADIVLEVHENAELPQTKGLSVISNPKQSEEPQSELRLVA